MGARLCAPTARRGTSGVVPRRQPPHSPQPPEGPAHQLRVLRGPRPAAPFRRASGQTSRLPTPGLTAPGGLAGPQSGPTGHLPCASTCPSRGRPGAAPRMRRGRRGSRWCDVALASAVDTSPRRGCLRGIAAPDQAGEWQMDAQVTRMAQLWAPKPSPSGASTSARSSGLSQLAVRPWRRSTPSWRSAAARGW